MLKLDIKVAIQLQVITLIVAGLSGYLIEYQMQSLFLKVVQDRTPVSFRRDLASYVDHYGSWEDAFNSEPFLDYTLRYRAELQESSSIGAGILSSSDTQPSSLSTTTGLEPAPAYSPFYELSSFLATDTTGYVWLTSSPTVAVGDILSEATLSRAEPIYDHGEFIGYATTELRNGLAEMDAEYSGQLRNSLRISLLLVLCFCVPLSFMLAWRKFRD